MSLENWFDYLVEEIGDRFRRDGEEMFLEWLEERDPPDPELGKMIQVRLGDMHLGRSRDWGRDRAPVLYSRITTPGGIDVPMTISPDAFQRIDEHRFRWTEQNNLPLCGLVPWNVLDGELHITVGLLYVVEGGLISAATGFISSLSELVQIPHLSTAADIAQRVSTGAESLIGQADPKGRVGVDTGIGWDDLKSGYLLAVGAAEDTVDISQLSVDQTNHRLQYQDGSASDLNAFDYVLLEVRIADGSGNAWLSIPSISEPYHESIRTLRPDKVEESKALLYAAQSAAGSCPDLTLQDRNRVSTELYRLWKQQKDAVLQPLGDEGHLKETPLDLAIEPQ